MYFVYSMEHYSFGINRLASTTITHVWLNYIKKIYCKYIRILIIENKKI